MDEFKFFKTFKERGEWIEMRFMAEAMRHGYKVLRPWGDSQPFDVAINFGSRFVRVQVKSTTCRAGTGYHCEFERSSPKSSYTLKQADFFAVCVITENAWYLIPARALLNGDHLKKGAMLCPTQRTKASPTTTNATAKPGPCCARNQREEIPGGAPDNSPGRKPLGKPQEM